MIETEAKLYALSAAYKDGAASARRLEVGQVFTGAYGAFDVSGRPEDHRTMFVMGYLHCLHERGVGVATDPDKRIVAFD